MRVIALMNQKGGVGKTTTTVNLGAALAEYGRRVCLMDMDPQAHLTVNYGIEPTDETPTLYDVLVNELPLLDALLGIDKGISLVPSHIDLAAAEVELVSVPGRETLLRRRLEAAIADPSKEWDYDFILIDCPPSLGLLTLNALALADEVLIPMQPQFLAMQGASKLLETVWLISKQLNPKLRVSGIVLTLYDSQVKLSSEVLNELNAFIEVAKGQNKPWSGARVFETKIRRNIKLAESPGHGEHILKYDSGSNGAADYRALAREVLGITDEQGKAIVAAANPPAVAAAEAGAGTGGAGGAVAKPKKPRKPRTPKAAAVPQAGTAAAPSTGTSPNTGSDAA